MDIQLKGRVSERSEPDLILTITSAEEIVTIRIDDGNHPALWVEATLPQAAIFPVVQSGRAALRYHADPLTGEADERSGMEIGDPDLVTQEDLSRRLDDLAWRPALHADVFDSMFFTDIESFTECPYSPENREKVVASFAAFEQTWQAIRTITKGQATGRLWGIGEQLRAESRVEWMRSMPDEELGIIGVLAELTIARMFFEMAERQCSDEEPENPERPS